MSILVEKIAKSNNSINDGDMVEHQYPPASIDDVNITTSSSSISIEFTWPNDTVLGGDTLVQVSEIVCLIKKGDIPYNTEDGYDNINTITSKDINSITFSGLEAETKYYIRFYVYGTNGECNNGGDMIYEVTTSKAVDPVLANNTWELINEIAESGTASEYWSIGDEITVHLSDPYNIDVVLQIWDFNHYDKSDGSGKAGIVLGCKDIAFGSPMQIASYSNEGGWEKTYMSNTVMENVYNSMPSSLQNVIKVVNIGVDTGAYNYNYYDIADKLFIPSLREVGLQQSTDPEHGKQFSIFTNNDSRVKYSKDGSIYYWWLRTSYSNNTGAFYQVSISGVYFYSHVQAQDGVVFCFNI